MAAPSDADANMVLEALARSQLPADQQAMLRAELEKSKKPRRKDMQDFSMFALYLPGSLWGRVCNIKEDNMAVCDAVTKYMAESLGLRCPNELTQGTLCGLLVFTMSEAEKEQKQSAHNLRAFFLTVKSRMQSVLAKYRKHPLPANCEYLTVLPSSKDELPGPYQNLGLEFAEPRVPLAEILKIANDIVYRKNGKALQSQVSMCADPTQMMQAFMTMPWVSALLAAVRDHRGGGEIPLQMTSKPKPAVQTLLDHAASQISPEASASIPTALPALEDKKPVDKLEQSAAPLTSQEEAPQSQQLTSSSSPMGLQESMNRLKAASQCQVPAQDTTKRTPSNRNANKRPPCMKRPASSSSAQKRPASSTAGNAMKTLKVNKPAKKKPSGKTTVKMSALKARILKLVSRSLKDQYKKGCPTCRHVPFCTPSCWAKRGFA